MTNTTAQQIELFSNAEGPDGFQYRPDLISLEEEQRLLGAVQELTFSEIKMHGVVAKRRTIHFGWTYDFQTFRLGPAPEIPPFLIPLRSRIAEFSHIPEDQFAEVLVTEYQSGAGIGWHRDAPQFGVVVGVSILSECLMEFRPWPVKESEQAKSRRKTVAQLLAARSAYVLDGAVREKWQHRIRPTKSLRYSVTFRTVRSALLGVSAGR